MVFTLPDTRSAGAAEHWNRRILSLHYAFQPIVNIHTGAALGFEALLRGVGDAGFDSIRQLFDRAYEEEVLYSLDLHLREMAVDAFYSNPAFSGLKLFYNIFGVYSKVFLMIEY